MGADVDFQGLLEGLKSVTPEELAEAHNNMLASIADWVESKYPNIRLQTVERNLPKFLEIKKYDDACAICMGTGMCPTQDGNRMNGRLDADGIVTIWMEPCPRGYRISKIKQIEAPTKKWQRSDATLRLAKGMSTQ